MVTRSMRDHEAAMSVYIQLAVLSEQKQQPLVRDRFLLLGGVEACRAGWPDVAARCLERLVQSNPAHQAGRHPTMADALRDPDFQQLVAHWERYCPFEKAELLLHGLQPLPWDEAEGSAGERMLKLLAHADRPHHMPP